MSHGGYSSHKRLTRRTQGALTAPACCKRAAPSAWRRAIGALDGQYRFSANTAASSSEKGTRRCRNVGLRACMQQHDGAHMFMLARHRVLRIPSYERMSATANTLSIARVALPVRKAVNWKSQLARCGRGDVRGTYEGLRRALPISPQSNRCVCNRAASRKCGRRYKAQNNCKNCCVVMPCARKQLSEARAR